MVLNWYKSGIEMVILICYNIIIEKIYPATSTLIRIHRVGVFCCPEIYDKGSENNDEREDDNNREPGYSDSRGVR